MSQLKNVLLLNGSPKGEESSSRHIGKYLVDRLEGKGLKSQEAFIKNLICDPEGSEKLFRQVDDADIIVFTTPLYVDSLPSFTIKAMEFLCDHRKADPQAKSSLLVAVMNCGFPEKEQMEVATRIIQNFADEAKLRWGGAVTVGMGESLKNQLLNETNGMTRNLALGLSLAANALAMDQPMPVEASELASKPFMPPSITKSMIVEHIKQVWNNKTNGKIDMYAKPYERH